ncbi:MAG: hypothetical protein ABSD71_07880, partial [Bacteroidales bacterium]
MRETDINTFKTELYEIFSSLYFQKLTSNERIDFVSYRNADKVQCDFDFRKEKIVMNIMHYSELATNEHDVVNNEYDALQDLLEDLAAFDSSLKQKIIAILRKRKLKK